MSGRWAYSRLESAYLGPVVEQASPVVKAKGRECPGWPRGVRSSPRELSGRFEGSSRECMGGQREARGRLRGVPSK